ncbi:MAG: hypothetical protein WDN45_01815 [Caulobacteraceae bacterium]
MGIVATTLEFVRRQNPVIGRRVATVGSYVVIAAGAFWFVQRVLFPGGKHMKRIAILSSIVVAGLAVAGIAAAQRAGPPPPQKGRPAAHQGQPLQDLRRLAPAATPPSSSPKRAWSWSTPRWPTTARRSWTWSRPSPTSR